MDILPTNNATIRESYSRLEVKQTLLKETGASSGSNEDSVFLTQFLSYEQYTYSSDLTAAGSSAFSTPEAGSAEQSGGVAASTQLFGRSFLDTIQNRVKFLLEALAGNDTESDGSDLFAASSDTAVIPEESSAGSLSSSDFSVERTASRIVEFALSFFDGGDRGEYASKVEDAVMKGYSQALEAMGGSLPAIAGDTISQVMDQLQQFASGADINTLA